jgi:hypothetical protein
MPTISGYASGEPIEAVDINTYFLRGNRNAIINGDMRVAQRGTSLTVADGAYGLDRWVAVGSGAGGVGSSGQNVSMLQIAATGTDSVNAMQFGTTTAGLKFGVVQIVENRNLGGLRSGTVTVSFKIRRTSLVTDVRCAVLGWSGTADAVTRDVVSTSGTPWLSSPPTLAADWSYLNTPENLNITEDFATYSVNANVTGNPNNLAVFIWVNGISGAGEPAAIQLTDVQLESGAIATPFDRKTFQEQLADCQRYYWRIFGKSGGKTILPSAFVTFSITAAQGWLPFVVPMRVIPTSLEVSGLEISDIVSFDASGGTFTFSANASTTHAIWLEVSGLSGASNGFGRIIKITASTSSFFGVSAEL